MHDTEDYTDDECIFDAPVDGWAHGAENPDTVRVYVSGDHGRERIPHLRQEPSVEESDDCNGDICHLGYCRQREHTFACDTDTQCQQQGYAFCHEFLGCVAEPRCIGNDDCGGDDFCWYGTCFDEDYQCTTHDDCDDEWACHDGLCRDADGDMQDNHEAWCPYQQDTTCEDLDEDWDEHFCHEKTGCVEQESYECTDDSECESEEEFCWLGRCVPQDDQCDYTGGHWEFAEDSNGTQIQLKGSYCKRAQGDTDINEVEVRRACACEASLEEAGVEIGDDCRWVNPPGQSNNPDNEACPAGGQIICEDGYAVCDHTGPPPDGDVCEQECDDYAEGSDCTPGCDAYFWGADGKVMCDGEHDDPQIEQGINRCATFAELEDPDGAGRFVCTPGSLSGGEEMCPMREDFLLRPMPELCDGLDSSCDGNFDNIEESWEQFRNQEGPWDWQDSDVWTEEDHQEFMQYNLYELTPDNFDEWDALNGDDIPSAAACFGKNICSSHACDGKHVGSDQSNASVKDELKAYLKAYSGGFDGCQCSPD